jgi:hypothetical protein
VLETSGTPRQSLERGEAEARLVERGSSLRITIFSVALARDRRRAGSRAERSARSKRPRTGAIAGAGDRGADSSMS